MAESSDPNEGVARGMQESSNDESDWSSSSEKISFQQFQPKSRRFEVDQGEVAISSATSSRLPDTQPQARKNSQSHAAGSTIPRFEFINTTGPEQYSEADARSRARAHVMRQVHMEKDKERASRALRSPRAHQPQSGEGSNELIKLANLGLIWHGPAQGNLRPKPPNLNGVTAPVAGPSQLSGGPIEHHVQTVIAAAGPSEPQSRPEDHPRGGIPLAHLGGLEQRLVAPRTVTPGPFVVDLNAVEMVRHCARVFAQNSIPMSEEFEAEWFNQALRDPACYHGAMFISTAHRIRVFGLQNQIPPEFYHHKGEVIRLINQRLDDPEARVEDGTLTAITCLAAFENMMGSEALASLHVEGIKRLVTMRGGMDKLGMAGLLRTMILWVDMGNSLSVMRRPRFCPWNGRQSTITEETEYQALLETQWQDWCLPQPPIKHYPNFDDIMTRIFHRLRQLSSIALEHRTESESRCRPIYASHALILESHMNGSFWGDMLNEERDANAMTGATNKAFHVAGFIYVYLALREIPLEVIIYNKTVARLKAILETLDQSQSFGGLEAGFLLWVLVVGGAAAFGRPERSWFVTMLTRLRQVLQLQSWADAQPVLMEYPWVENSFATLTKGFWEESERMDEVTGMYRI